VAHHHPGYREEAAGWTSVSGIRFYGLLVQRKLALIFALLALCGISLVVDIATGPASLGFLDVLSALFRSGQMAGNARVIVRVMRLPIALMAIAAGANLGLAGAVMQTILGNPLASPYTLGIGSGAAFGASLAIVAGIGVIPTFGEYLVSVNAFFFSMLACILLYLLGRNRKMPTETMVLSGIALLFIFQALQALLQYGASEGEVQTIVFWSFGSLQKANGVKVACVFAVLSVCLPILLKRSWAFTALLMGEEKASSFGIRVDHLKITSFIAISLLTAVSVCFVGTIGFIGLAGPHIARMLVEEDQRFYLPVSALCGALLLSVASIVSKSIVPGVVFPIGIVTSIIGVPFFFVLIWKTRRG
jgi:iron complex transport system permease protein